jgi:hypothetical protein
MTSVLESGDILRQESWLDYVWMSRLRQVEPVRPSLPRRLAESTRSTPWQGGPRLTGQSGTVSLLIFFQMTLFREHDETLYRASVISTVPVIALIAPLFHYIP